MEGFSEPADAILVGNDVFVIKDSGEKGNIRKIRLPGESRPAKANAKKKIKS